MDIKYISSTFCVILVQSVHLYKVTCRFPPPLFNSPLAKCSSVKLCLFIYVLIFLCGHQEPGQIGSVQVTDPDVGSQLVKYICLLKRRARKYTNLIRTKNILSFTRSHNIGRKLTSKSCHQKKKKIKLNSLVLK